MTSELIAFVATLRALDQESTYTMWLAARRQTEREREAKRTDIADAWDAFALVLDAKYAEESKAA